MTQFEITKLLYSIYDDLNANVDGIKLKMDSVNDDQIIKIYIEDPEASDDNHMEKMLSVIINHDNFMISMGAGSPNDWIASTPMVMDNYAYTQKVIQVLNIINRHQPKPKPIMKNHTMKLIGIDRDNGSIYQVIIDRDELVNYLLEHFPKDYDSKVAVVDSLMDMDPEDVDSLITDELHDQNEVDYEIKFLGEVWED